MTTAGEIAALLGSTTSIPEAEVARVSSIEAATGDAVVFATDGEALAAAKASSAGLILSSADADARVVAVGNPRLAFAQVYQAFFVARTACIDPSAVIGEGVEMGEGCWIGPRVTIYAGTVLGRRVTVQAGAVLGSPGFGYVRERSGRYIGFPQIGRLVIEDDVEIGANSTIDRGALGETRIGRGTKIDNLVHIGHNCRIGEDVVIAAQTGISGSSIVEDGAILGGQVGIGEHATVGAGVILGGGAGVLSGKKMRGPGEVFWGRPARPLKEYLRDLARLKRR
jgi:UDP-3-O-[3-hydroxymyristoyl] glucosamine N-acyltransferase